MSYQLSRLDLVTNAGSTTISVGTTPTGQTYVTGDIPQQDNLVKVSRSDDIKTSPILVATIQSTSSAQNLSGVTLNLPEGSATLQSNTDLLGQNYTYDGDVNTQLLVGHGVDSSSTSIVDLTSNNNTIVYGGTGTSSAAGSLSFNGTNQFLSVAVGGSGTTFDLSTATFTVEAWVYIASTTSRLDIAGGSAVTTVGNNTIDWVFFVEAGGAVSFSNIATSVGLTVTGTTITANTWNHVAVTRTGASATVWVNGAGTTGTVYATSNTNNGTFAIGSMGAYNLRYWNGYITNFRLIKGTAQYTSVFTPTVPLTNVTNTKLLLLTASDANKLVDSSSSPITLTNNNSVTYSTVVPSTGGATAVATGSSPYTTSQFNCFKFDGTGFLNVPDSTAWYIVPTTTSITFEAWFYPTSHPATAYFASQTSSTSTYPWAMYFVNGKPTWSACAVAGTVVFTASSATTLSLNTWTHVAWVYEASANRFVVYINGVREVLATNAVAMFNSADSLRIGASTTTAGIGVNFYNGYIADIRATNSATTYSGNFTVPTGNILASYPIANPYGGSNTAAMTSTAGGGNYCYLLISAVGGANNVVFDASSLNNTVTNTNVFPAYIANSGRSIATTYNSASFNYGINWTTSVGAQALSYSHHSGLDLSTGAPNWCIEGWIYWSGQLPTGATAGQSATIIEKDAGNGYVAASYNLSINTSGILRGTIGPTSAQTIGLLPVPVQIWTHVAFVRKGTVITLYINGVTSESATITATMVDGSFTATVGSMNPTGYQGGGYFQGYINNFRVVKGNNVYSGTSTITPNFSLPTQAFSSAQIGYGRNGVTGNQTGYLLGFVGTNATVCDLSVWANLPAGGGGTVNLASGTAANLPTAITTIPTNLSLPSSTYNYNSVYLNGSGYLNFLSGKPFQLGQEEFTVEFCFYQDSLASAVLIDNFPSVSTIKGVWQIWTSTATGVVQFNMYDDTAVNRTITSAANAYAAKSWVHVALVRRKSFAIGVNQFTVTLYVNGTSAGTLVTNSYLGVDTLASTPTLARGANIGRQTSDGTLLFTGYVSDLRIIKQAVYNNNFAPPTTQLTTTVQSTTALSPLFGALSFDGTSKYLSVPYVTSGNMDLVTGAPDWTVEYWINFNDVSGANIISKDGWSGHYNPAITMYITSGVIYGLVSGNYQNAPNCVVAGPATTPIRANVWYHIAWVRNGSTFTLYVNGVAGTPATLTFAIGSATDSLYIGATNDGFLHGFINGYIANFRIVKGTAVYTTNFTAPTLGTPLSNITNTVLLLNAPNEANRLYDAAGNTGITGNPIPSYKVIYDINNTNNTGISPINVINTGNVTYTKATSGYDTGGGYLNFVSPSRLTIPNSTLLDMGNGDFTIETWFYPTSTIGSSIFTKRSSNFSVSPVQLNWASGAFTVYMSTDGTNWLVQNATSTYYPINNWYHVALIRRSNYIYLYINGVSSITPVAISSAVTTNTDPFVIGADAVSPGSAIAGYITNFRIVKGTAMYTANFTPPTTSLLNVSGTSLLLKVSSANNYLLDSSGNFTVTNTGGVTYVASSSLPIGTTGVVARYEPLTVKSEYTLNYTPSLSTTKMYDTGVTGSVTINSYNTVNDSSKQVLSANLNIPVKNNVEFFINGTDAVTTGLTDPNFKDVRIRPVTNLTDPRRVDAKRPLFNQSGITGETVLDQQSWIN